MKNLIPWVLTFMWMVCAICSWNERDNTNWKYNQLQMTHLDQGDLLVKEKARNRQLRTEVESLKNVNKQYRDILIEIGIVELVNGDYKIKEYKVINDSSRHRNVRPARTHSPCTVGTSR